MDARTLSPPTFLVMPQQAPTTRAPTSPLDPYTDQALLKPWPLYRELREMGSAVWLEKYEMFALTRYDVVVKALRDSEAFRRRSAS